MILTKVSNESCLTPMTLVYLFVFGYFRAVMAIKGICED